MKNTFRSIILFVGAGIFLSVSTLKAEYGGNTVEADTVTFWDFNGDVNGDPTMGGWPNQWVHSDRAHPGEYALGSSSHWYIGSGASNVTDTDNGIDLSGIRPIATPDLQTRTDDYAYWNEDNWTAECWVKWDDATSVNTLKVIMQRTHNWQLYLISGSKFGGFFRWHDTSATVGDYSGSLDTGTTFTKPTAGVWYHIAIVGESGQQFGSETGTDLRITYYLNAETDETPTPAGTIVMEEAGVNLGWGKEIPSNGNGTWILGDGGFAGVIDDVKYSNTARTTFESLVPTIPTGTIITIR